MEIYEMQYDALLSWHVIIHLHKEIIMSLDPKNIGPNQEQYEYFERRTGPMRKKRLCQYDYRDNSGKLFSCVATTFDEARSRRDEWLASR